LFTATISEAVAGEAWIFSTFCLFDWHENKSAAISKNGAMDFIGMRFWELPHKVTTKPALYPQALRPEKCNQEKTKQ
jgi:hypothetical protein